MSKNFKTFRHMALGYILIVGLAIGLVTPIVQAEAPVDGSYTSLNSAMVVDGLTQIERAAKINAFFLNRDHSPLAGYGLAFVQAADKYGIDWKLVAAIGTIESNGGRMPCIAASGKNNLFGWGSCKIPFESVDQAIDVVTYNLAGHNPNTARYYKGKSISDVIDTYNPPSVRHDYNELVTWAMNKIASTDATQLLAVK